MAKRGNVSESKKRRNRIIITVYFFPEDKPLLEAVRRKARREDRSIASIFRLALREYMEPEIAEETMAKVRQDSLPLSDLAEERA